MQQGKPNAGLIPDIQRVVSGDFPETAALSYGLYFEWAWVQGGFRRQPLQGWKLPFHSVHQCLDFVQIILVLVEILVTDMVGVR